MSSSGKYILVADDEPKMRRVMEILLKQLGHTVFAAGDGREALALARANPLDLVITDLRMPELDGIGLLTALRAEGNEVPVIVITAHGTVESAVSAMKLGAADYLLRPFDLDALELAITRVLGAAGIRRENAFLREEVERGRGTFVGDGAAMRAVYELIGQVAPTRSTVLITGETGTGKELAARAIHDASPRRDKLFVPINCAAIPAEVLEAELFGHEKGAFTGAVRERVGKFELADGGTLFLDELTEMPVALQAKLLRVLQESTLERLGGNRSIPLDLRLVAATNRDPRQAVREGRLREDLYYRVNVFSIALPPLRQRKEDIPALVAHFIAKHGPAGQLPRVDAAALEVLSGYDWPGNVRELQNMVERALVLARGGPLRAEHFPMEAAPAGAPPGEPGPPPLGRMNEVVEALEARMIDEALAQTEGNKARAAALLDISERTLWYKLKKYRPKDKY
ncbi:response regulator [Azoarcus sp. TTM-91]|uniref:sigma-54-dependent transcriptional regulator n=1 Tax=Azoarcus sp. TTM-91 TaxID=2691581 RepID=UPI00145E9608|nr:sigma-54 dependent transcriptional regulator [Azoarcus sp. TTM-91]NMG36746.1 response regulator [Azoarcus sp. TTM-91]